MQAVCLVTDPGQLELEVLFLRVVVHKIDTARNNFSVWTSWTYSRHVHPRGLHDGFPHRQLVKLELLQLSLRELTTFAYCRATIALREPSVSGGEEDTERTDI